MANPYPGVWWTNDWLTNPRRILRIIVNFRAKIDSRKLWPPKSRAYPSYSKKQHNTNNSQATQSFNPSTDIFPWTPTHNIWGGFNTATDEHNNPPYPAAEPSEPPRKKIKPNTQEDGEDPSSPMVESGTSGGELEGPPVLTGGEGALSDGLIAKDSNSKTEMVRLIIQSLQHLGYGWVLRDHIYHFISPFIFVRLLAL